MPSEAPVLPTPTEKPHHYTYLKEFRTQQCPLFLQHKCTQHRPFTCFHWHFMNQRRRRPVRRRDGTFNYSPDVYCTKYDETTGICPEGDECPYLHRTAGDTERRYQLRYYKTCTCVYETDVRGHCVKNGAHCAFAHGAQDLRPPVYDVRELQNLEIIPERSNSLGESPLGSSLEKDRIINEDPRWNDTNYVLANYKTEQCKRPPRLCRQGYACPSHHNNRDRRRSPKKFKYRSTPCPNVKHGDDWGDPAQCESLDNCPYCHTRTEQQFHPEIYKSTKCNDMVQTGYCPRGPFCAFAHVEQEMTTQRDVTTPGDNSLAAFVTNALPHNGKEDGHVSDGEDGESKASHSTAEKNGGNNHQRDGQKHNDLNADRFTGVINYTTHNGGLLTLMSNGNGNNASNNGGSIAFPTLPEPIGKGRAGSISSSIASESSNSSYHKAPGSEREDIQVKLRHQLQAIENDNSLDQSEKSKRKHNLLLLHNLNIGSSHSLGSPPPTPPSTVSSSMSPHAPSFYPAGDTVESVIGNALDDDLNLGELSLPSLERDLVIKEYDNDDNHDTNSVCSSLSAGFPATSYLGATSVPVTIPSAGAGYQRSSVSSLSQSPCSSPIGSLPPTFVPQHIQQQQKQEQQIHEAAAAFLSQPNPGKFAAPGFTERSSMSPRTNGSVSQSPLLHTSTIAPGAANGYGDVHKMREELASNKIKLAQWEEGIAQARSACDAWKREAEECARKAKMVEEENRQLLKQRDEALAQMATMRLEVTQLRGGGASPMPGTMTSPFLALSMQQANDLETLPLAHLKQMQGQFRIELERVDKAVFKHTTIKCMHCQEKNRSVRVLPCNHYVFCDVCANKCLECPLCHQQITHRTPVVMPM